METSIVLSIFSLGLIVYIILGVVCAALCTRVNRDWEELSPAFALWPLILVGIGLLYLVRWTLFPLYRFVLTVGKS